MLMREKFLFDLSKINFADEFIGIIAAGSLNEKIKKKKDSQKLVKFDKNGYNRRGDEPARSIGGIFPYLH